MLFVYLFILKVVLLFAYYTIKKLDYSKDLKKNKKRRAFDCKDLPYISSKMKT